MAFYKCPECGEIVTHMKEIQGEFCADCGEPYAYDDMHLVDGNWYCEACWMDLPEAYGDDHPDDEDDGESDDD